MTDRTFDSIARFLAEQQGHENERAMAQAILIIDGIFDGLLVSPPKNVRVEEDGLYAFREQWNGVKSAVVGDPDIHKYTDGLLGMARYLDEVVSVGTLWNDIMSHPLKYRLRHLNAVGVEAMVTEEGWTDDEVIEDLRHLYERMQKGESPDDLADELHADFDRP